MALSDALGFSGLFGASASNAAELIDVDEDRKVRLGMFFYTLGDLILAIFFIGSYIFLRGYNTNDRWVPPPMAHVIGSGPLTATAWLMVAAVAGAGLFAVGQWALYWDRYGLFTGAMAAALALYVVDLVAQVYVLGHQPYDVTDGSFASAFTLLSGYHVFHMLVCVFLGIGIVNRAARGCYRRPAERGMPNAHVAAAAGREGPNMTLPRKTTGIAAIGYYWYYVALYAVAVWLLLLIQPPLLLNR
ncbi:MAG TPA: hypothetical protein VHB98_24520 [Chloroflexota bacterium]|nr:hypothetical protein [Chloroflexota bacterium]